MHLISLAIISCFIASPILIIYVTFGPFCKKMLSLRKTMGIKTKREKSLITGIIQEPINTEGCLQLSHNRNI